MLLVMSEVDNNLDKSVDKNINITIQEDGLICVRIIDNNNIIVATLTFGSNAARRFRDRLTKCIVTAEVAAMVNETSFSKGPYR